MQISLGLDQAGRGSLIGSMFICGAIVQQGAEQSISQFKDSKLYANTAIERMYTSKIRGKFTYEIAEVLPKEIDQINLTQIQVKYFAKIINKLKPDFVFIDCPSSNVLKFKNQVCELLTFKPLVFCQHKMDQNQRIVGLASIIAKRYRQRHVKTIEQDYKVYIGSGYPSDVRTREFVKKNPDFKLIRRKWKLKSE